MPLSVCLCNRYKEPRLPVLHWRSKRGAACFSPLVLNDWRSTSSIAHPCFLEQSTQVIFPALIEDRRGGCVEGLEACGVRVFAFQCVFCRFILQRLCHWRIHPLHFKFSWVFLSCLVKVRSVGFTQGWELRCNREWCEHLSAGD